MLNKIQIIGCGGHARSVADVAIENNPNIDITFFDINAKADEWIMSEKYKVYHLDQFHTDDAYCVFVAYGNNLEREDFFRKLRKEKTISIISAKAAISSCSKIGLGTFIGNNTHIGPEAEIGDNCIINTGAIIEHECKIGDSSHISVGSKICGRTVIGKRVFVGSGATVIDGIRIVDDVIIGAGAVVVSDISEKGTYVGMPAKRI